MGGLAAPLHPSFAFERRSGGCAAVDCGSSFYFGKMTALCLKLFGDGRSSQRKPLKPSV